MIVERYALNNALEFIGTIADSGMARVTQSDGIDDGLDPTWVGVASRKAELSIQLGLSGSGQGRQRQQEFTEGRS